jgi:IstB-like ATP binding protein
MPYGSNGKMIPIERKLPGHANRSTTFDNTSRGAYHRPDDKGLKTGGRSFGDDVMASALLDRRVHHCHIVNSRGNSYRVREHV